VISFFGPIRRHLQVLFVGVKGALSRGLKMHGIIRANDRAPNGQIIHRICNSDCRLKCSHILFTEDASQEN